MQPHKAAKSWPASSEAGAFPLWGICYPHLDALLHLVQSSDGHTHILCKLWQDCGLALGVQDLGRAWAGQGCGSCMMAIPGLWAWRGWWHPWHHWHLPASFSAFPDCLLQVSCANSSLLVVWGGAERQAPPRAAPLLSPQGDPQGGPHLPSPTALLGFLCFSIPSTRKSQGLCTSFLAGHGIEGDH